MSQPIEQQAADTILQNCKEVHIGNKTYHAAPPTLATLISVSRAITYLPHCKLNQDNIVAESLYIARHCEAIANILAILILGAKAYNEPSKTPSTILYRLLHIKPKTKGDVLSYEVINTLTPTELSAIFSQLLQGMQLSDFFALTTFLTEVNLLKPTKVENKTKATAHGL
ncbi:hypothetical protein HMPREF1860_02002 [Prevotella amnii]|uniref:Uncharacterized protein n=1 Tax=Prevotella amnii TaxID=419005 RepID=A0A134B3P0_9BACT|nr:hypothetical protein [Prevotella amnii]KXB74563.1 hypothetical protein HMPREF1860_02002 [Prevotella amnii]